MKGPHGDAGDAGAASRIDPTMIGQRDRLIRLISDPWPYRYVG